VAELQIALPGQVTKKTNKVTDFIYCTLSLLFSLAVSFVIHKLLFEYLIIIGLLIKF